MTDKVFLIDVDGVLAETTAAWCRELNRVRWYHVRGPDRVRPDDIKEWDLRKALPDAPGNIYEPMLQQEFCAGISPAHGAANFLMQLRGLGEVYAATAPMSASKYWLQERAEWLIRELDFDMKHIISADAKHLIRGDMLLDDKVENVCSWAIENRASQAVLWTAPYNTEFDTSQCGILRADTWERALEIARSIK